MPYIELSCRIEGDNNNAEIVTAYLGDAEFESFDIAEDGNYLAYIKKENFKKENIVKILNSLAFVKEFNFRDIEEQNWNEVWESNFPSVEISDDCIVRAPFHEKSEKYKYDLIIEPQMSFGTAHHETTSQMLQLLLNEDVKNRSLLDMGCGTAVLAILAHKLGAKNIEAIDNDDWAYRNSLHNCKLNNISDIAVFQGDANSISGKTFDIILANINRNILLNDISSYAKCLPENGILMMSGFYEADLPIIKKETAKHKLTYHSHLSKNRWVAVKFCKTI